MNLHKFCNLIFQRVTIKELVAQELAEAERALLNAQTGQEYAAAIMSYNQARIRRLRGYLKEGNSD